MPVISVADGLQAVSRLTSSPADVRRSHRTTTPSRTAEQERASLEGTMVRGLLIGLKHHDRDIDPHHEPME